jgi:HEAT repeat protein
MEAARQLAERDSDAARKLLLRMVDDSDPAVATQAVESLGNHPDPARREVVARLLGERNRPAQVRAMAAATYGRFGGADPTPLIEAMASGEDPVVRAGAAHGLTRLKDPRSLPALLLALEDGDARVRLWAISAIHKMTVRRFQYNAAVAPAEQREVIQRIKDYLRSCGVQGIE